LIFFLLFFFIFKTSNNNINLIKKIDDCKIKNTFENLNSSEMTLKMLTMMQIYQKCNFLGFSLFFCYFL